MTEEEIKKKLIEVAAWSEGYTACLNWILVKEKENGSKDNSVPS